MKYVELARLLADGQFRSGEYLGEKLGISRAAVWKQVTHLRNRGIDVHAVKGKGYRFAKPIELLNDTLIYQALSEQARQCIDQFEVFSEIDSTNQYLLKQIFLQQNKSYVCLAEYQNKGKGRRGRQWISPYASNIYLSVLWRFKANLGTLEGLSLIVAIAVAEALCSMGLRDVKVKWPNDVIYHGRKLAGILLETAGDFSAPAQVVIGVGLNVDMPKTPSLQIDQPWTDIAACSSVNISRNVIGAALIQSLMVTLTEYEQNGFENYRARWEALDYVKGKIIDISFQEGVLQGMAQGVDKRGALLVKTMQGIQAFHSGEVSLRLAKDQLPQNTTE